MTSLRAWWWCSSAACLTSACMVVWCVSWVFDADGPLLAFVFGALAGLNLRGLISSVRHREEILRLWKEERDDRTRRL